MLACGQHAGNVREYSTSRLLQLQTTGACAVLAVLVLCLCCACAVLVPQVWAPAAVQVLLQVQLSGSYCAVLCLCCGGLRLKDTMFCAPAVSAGMGCSCWTSLTATLPSCACA
jgi:hypothetical protein